MNARRSPCSSARIEIGMNFIDTADHNNGNNEEILAKVLKAGAAMSC